MRVIEELLEWRAILDITIIAAVVFLLYRMLRAMGTWKIAVGILVALGFFVVASLLQLRTIEWVYSNLSQVLVIGIFIVFQPEIRKALERITAFRRFRGGGKGGAVPEILADTAQRLVAVKSGALIVLPGRDSIEQHTSGGTQLDAALSPSLLLSIFDTSSPGHDGAVIVEGRRATSFGVRLPLSEGSGQLPAEYGTRHHAALGLAQKTDALAIAVSEERGTVTAFRGGAGREVAPAELDRVVRSHLKAIAPRVGVRGSGGNRLFPLEVGSSILVALLLWTSVVIIQGEIHEKTLAVPVVYRMPSRAHVLQGSRPQEITLHLAGPASDLGRVDAAGTRLIVDLSGADPGLHDIKVTPDQVNLPRRVRILDAEPPVFKVQLARLRELELPIRADLQGIPPPSIESQSVQLNPMTVKVLVPPDHRDLTEVKTAPIPRAEITKNTEMTVDLAPPAEVRPAGESWPKVAVKVSVRPKQPPPASPDQ